MKRVGLKDISLATGLSVNTVSHALQGKPDISEKTRKIVEEKAEALGYVKNLLASSLRSNTSKTIAILYDNFLNPYYSIMMTFLERILADNGYGIMIFTESNKDALFTESVYKAILSHNADGIISFLQAEDKVRAHINSLDTKIVIVGRECEYFDCVFSDDVKGGYEMTKHLIECGHRRIMMLCSQPEVSCGVRRLEGYKKALTEAGIPVDEQLIFYWGRDYYTAKDVLEKCKTQNIQYDVILCFNDFIAYETINYLETNGKRVPEDVAVAGFDNLHKELAIFKKITTIDPDNQNIAKTAVDVLLDKLKNRGSEIVKKMNDVRLIKGRTT